MCTLGTVSQGWEPLALLEMETQGHFPEDSLSGGSKRGLSAYLIVATSRMRPKGHYCLAPQLKTSGWEDSDSKLGPCSPLLLAPA